jgi:hypothetical protein
LLGSGLQSIRKTIALIFYPLRNRISTEYLDMSEHFGTHKSTNIDQISGRIERFGSQFIEEIKTAYRICAGVVGISSWFARLDQLTGALERGNGSYRQVEDHLFDLKVMNYVIESFPQSRITYEPKGVIKDSKDCDLEVVTQERRYLVEMKMFHPEWKKAEVPEQFVAENNTLMMDGESYHTYQATRGHLIDVTYEAEEKFRNYKDEYISVLAVPVGFHLSIEEFRDFVFIYRNGSARPDDALGPMTMHNLRRPFEGSIDMFWAFPFPQDSFYMETGETATIVAPLMHQDTAIVLGEKHGPF